MSKLLLKFSAAFLTFSIGVFLVGLITLLSSPIISEKQDFNVYTASLLENKRIFPVSENNQIKIRLKRFIQTRDGLTAEFEIVNHNTKPAFYSGYETEVNGVGGQGIPYVKVNGKDIEQFICGTGLKNFELKSGESLTHIISGAWLSAHLDKGKNLQIGFSFSFSEDGERYRKYWSEVLPLTDSIRAQLSKEAKQRLKNE